VVALFRCVVIAAWRLFVSDMAVVAVDESSSLRVGDDVRIGSAEEVANNGDIDDKLRSSIDDDVLDGDCIIIWCGFHRENEECSDVDATLLFAEA